MGATNSLLRFSAAMRARSLEAQGQLAIESARQSVRLRAQQATRSVPMMLTSACLIFIAYSFVLSPWRIAGWVVPMAGVWIVNLPICRNALTDLQNASVLEIVQRQSNLLSMSIGNAALIGCGLWWIGPGTDDHSIWFFTTTLQCLYTLGALINSSTHPRTFIAGATVNLGLAAFFWLKSGISGTPIAGALVCLVFLLARFSHQIKADFDETLRMRFENRELILELEAEKRRVETALGTAERASLAKSRFLAAASHDLRQPLHALMLFSGLLYNASPDQIKTFVTHIRKAADSLDKLFGGLLDLSQLDAKAIQPKIVNVLIKPLIESLADEFSPNAQAKGLLINVVCQDIIVKSDPFLLERILRNLIDNAIKYTDHGVITIQADTIQAEAILSVRDTGIGVNADERQAIFDEFFQLHNPLRNTDKGTGLGLAIVKRLADLLQHRIALESHPGVGSAFSLALELVRADAESGSITGPQSDNRTDTQFNDLHVMVIDDDAHVRVAMQHLLTSWGCRTSMFDSLDAALEALHSLPEAPGAIIADYRLQKDMNGFDAIVRLRERLGAIPAAVFTGEIIAFWPPALTDACIPVFQKPVRPEEIASWLGSVSATADTLATSIV